MKFSDGYWMVREGFDVLHPAQAHDVTADERSLSILAPTRVITARGDTLNRPTVTITLSTPLQGVIRVRIEHHTGGRDTGPNFDLPGADDPAPSIDLTGGEATFTSGDLTARVLRGQQWRLDFESAGSTLTSSVPKSIGLATGPDGETYVYQQLSLGVGERVYGLGERFGPVEKTGQTVEIWNADGGTSSEQAYKNVPFFWTNRGYGIFVNHPEQVSFEIGSEAVSRNQFSVPGQYLEYFVIHGPSPKDILEKYTALTGRPPRVPEWSFGLWLSTSFTTDYDEKTVSSFIDGMAEREIPLSVFHFDCFWMREFRWCDFEWDPITFPEPEAMLARLKAKGSADLRMDQPLHRPAVRAVRGGQGQGLPGHPGRRQHLAVGQVASRDGLGRLHQPCCCAMVFIPPGTADRSGRRRLQDRLRRADPDRRQLVRRVGPAADAQLLHASVQHDGVRPAGAAPGDR